MIRLSGLDRLLPQYTGYHIHVSDVVLDSTLRLPRRWFLVVQLPTWMFVVDEGNRVTLLARNSLDLHGK